MTIVWAELARESIASLRAHRLRSALAAGGITLGVAALMTAIAIGSGARRAALDEIGALGAANIYVRAVAPRTAPRAGALAPALTAADAADIARVIPDIDAVATLRASRLPMRGRDGVIETAVAAVSRSWIDVGSTPIASGRWFSDTEARLRSRVAVVGDRAAAALFGRADPVGLSVEAGGAWFTVVGVLAAPRHANAGDSVFLPHGALDVSIGRGDEMDRVSEIAIRVSGDEHVEAVALAIAALLARRYDPVLYEIVVPRQLLAARMRARRGFDVVLGAVALLALVIGGAGIMNIMLASVADRAHEIGVRRAVGASSRAIVLQFAAEASALCLAGAAAGVPLGVLSSWIVTLAAGWPVASPVSGAILAVAAAAAVGLGFGIYPAKVAARLDPIEALRAA